MCSPASLSPEVLEREIHKTSNRIVAVDILRVMAAFAVMYEHIVGHGANTAAVNKVSSFLMAPGTAYNCIFFLLAGYFACRNITWKKALVNAWWCFAPFVLWNIVNILLKMAGGAISWGEMTDFSSVLRLFGFPTPWELVDQGAENGRYFPCNYPLWFMRDLIFLFLLSPVLYRFSKLLFPLMIVAAIVPPCREYLASFAYLPLFLSSMSFFLMGCFLRTFSKETQNNILKFYSKYMIMAYLVIWGCRYAASAYGVKIFAGLSVFASPMLNGLLFIWILYQIARWIEVHSPFISRCALRLAPVTFLTFATHAIIFGIVGTLMPSVYASGALSLLLPIFMFAILTLCFEGMKRWARPLLHLVAHYKLRPDDVLPRARMK